MRLNRLFPILTAAALTILPACLDNETAKLSDYYAWRDLNLRYIDSISMVTEDGLLQYTPITPVWDKSFTIYMKWHNEEENPSAITPLSTSTCHVKYTLTSIAGDTLDSSASFKCVPNNMVTGFMAALTNMRVNDTVTAVLPYSAGYGVYGSNSILPFSTLVFGIRLDSISKLM